MTTREMKKKSVLYAKQLRADAEGLQELAKQLEKNCFEDADDYELISDQLPYIEQIGAEVNDLWENISVLAQDLKEYIDPDLTDAERDKFGF